MKICSLLQCMSILKVTLAWTMIEMPCMLCKLKTVQEFNICGCSIYNTDDMYLHIYFFY